MAGIINFVAISRFIGFLIDLIDCRGSWGLTRMIEALHSLKHVSVRSARIMTGLEALDTSGSADGNVHLDALDALVKEGKKCVVLLANFLAHSTRYTAFMVRGLSSHGEPFRIWQTFRRTLFHVDEVETMLAMTSIHVQKIVSYSAALERSVDGDVLLYLLESGYCQANRTNG